jgi:FtsH-binding integral membrane protein
MQDKPTFQRSQPYDYTIDQARYDAGLRQHMLRVYNYMLLGLVVTGGIAYYTSTDVALLQLLFATPLKWVVMLAPLGFIMVLSFGIQKLSAGMTQFLFWLFCGVMGLSLATIFLVFTGVSIVRVFFIASAMFAAMSLWGYTTQRDLSSMGSFLIMGLFGIIIASIVNLFLGSSALQFAISVIGVLVFTGLTAYDTQRIKELYQTSYGMQESNQKLAVMGALSLYLNFINLFMMLLHLLGSQRE